MKRNILSISSAMHAPRPETQQRISSAEDFFNLYPTYKFNPQTVFDVPSVVGSDAIRELYATLEPGLLVLHKITGEGSSLIMNLDEVVRQLLCVADLKFNCKRADVWYDDVEGPYEDEHPETGVNVSPYRHTEFVMTDTRIIKLVVNYRHHSLVTDAWEFWEACAEGIRACEQNEQNEQNEKNKKNVLSAPSPSTPHQDGTSSPQDTTSTTTTAQVQPMYVALTNWYDWRFLKIENNEITASPVLTPFPVCKEGVKFNDDLATTLQYLSCAYGITAQTGEEVRQALEKFNARFNVGRAPKPTTEEK